MACTPAQPTGAMRPECLCNIIPGVTMTLTRQLMVSIFILIILLLGSIFWLNFKHSQELLSSQVDKQTRNSVNTLALSLKPFLLNHDRQGIAHIADGFFKQGYYQSLSIHDSHTDKPLLERLRQPDQSDIPVWFRSRVSFENVIKHAEVLVYAQGHSKKYIVRLQADNTEAYAQFWQETRQWLALSVVLTCTALLVIMLLMRRQLAPLTAIEEQAIAISRKDFSINPDIPRSRELRRVVEAMNSMAGKLQQMINQLTEKAESLLKATRFDPLTGLMNRQPWLDNLQTLLARPGVVAIIHVHRLAEYNNAFGYITGNELLCRIADVLRQEQESYPEMVFGRLSGTDFVCLAPELNSDAFTALYAHLEQRLNRCLPAENNTRLQITVGATDFLADQHATELLARADHALSEAIHQSLSILCINEHQPSSASLSATNWGTLIDQCISESHITINSQPALKQDGSLLFQCLLAAPASAPDIRPAGFIAMAERLGRGSDFDWLVINHCLNHLQTEPDHGPWCIRLLASSWYNPLFQQQLLELLHSRPDISQQLFFTCSESALITDVSTSRRTIDALRHTGAGIVMDHFGRELSSFTALQQLRPDYIKVDGSYIRDIVSSPDHRSFLDMAIHLAHGLDIGIIAEHVESKAIHTYLSDKSLDALQGHSIAPVCSL